MRRAWTMWVVSSLLLLAAPAAAQDDAKLQKKLELLEKENAKLLEKLQAAREDQKKFFDQATQAEKAAGIDFRTATALASGNAPATVPPVDQPATKHGFARLDAGDLTLNMSFSGQRPLRSWRVYNASCEVTKRNR